MYRTSCEHRAVTYLVRRIRAEDWLELRRLRLEALKDSPLAFVEQYAEAPNCPTNGGKNVPAEPPEAANGPPSSPPSTPRAAATVRRSAIEISAL